MTICGEAVEDLVVRVPGRVLSGSWSMHAAGLAVDTNPFHNPYARDDHVLPELASAYVDPSHTAAGTIHHDDPS